MEITDNKIDIASLAPACFGSVSCFAKDSKCCMACVAFESCEKKSFETLAQIRNIVNVEDLVRQHMKARVETKEKRERNRQEMNIGRQEVQYGVKPELPQIVERATKVEKVVFEVGEDQEMLIAKMPVKAQPFALNLLKSGMIHDIKEGLAKHKNAIACKKPVWFVKTVQLLVDGGFTKAELKVHLMRELGWTDGSAAGHVSLGIVILTSFGLAAQDSFERYVVHPKIFDV